MSVSYRIFPTLAAGCLALSLLGCADPLTGVELHGVWGGDGVEVTISAEGATLEYDCAAGTMDERPDPDDDGRFVVTGTHTSGVGLPVDPNNPPQPRPARYDGRISGRTMTYSLMLTDTQELISTYRATLGERAELLRCL